MAISLCSTCLLSLMESSFGHPAIYVLSSHAYKICTWHPKGLKCNHKLYPSRVCTTEVHMAYKIFLGTCSIS